MWYVYNYVCVYMFTYLNMTLPSTWLHHKNPHFIILDLDCISRNHPQCPKKMRKLTQKGRKKFTILQSTTSIPGLCWSSLRPLDKSSGSSHSAGLGSCKCDRPAPWKPKPSNQAADSNPNKVLKNTKDGANRDSSIHVAWNKLLTTIDISEWWRVQA